MDVSTLPNSAANADTRPGGAQPAGPSAANVDFQTFLTLLTTQLKNQDPLQPMDSTQFVAQLASFSAVEQQVQTNKTLEGIQALLDGSGYGDFASWIGMDVLSPSAGHFAGAPMEVNISPETGADAIRLLVQDQNGNVVQAAPVPLGTDQILWAGVDGNGFPYPDGTYSFWTESSANDVVLSTQQAQVYSRVAEVRFENGAPVLMLESGATVSPDQVASIRAANDG